MAPTNDSEAAERLSELLHSLPPDPLVEVLRLAREVPRSWREMSVGVLIRTLRWRFDLTQRQLARLAGIDHAMLARVERGADLSVSALFQIFAGLGCDLVLLPESPLSATDLPRRTWNLTALIGRRRRRERWHRGYRSEIIASPRRSPRARKRAASRRPRQLLNSRHEGRQDLRERQ